jgi:hypothetical protein
MTETSQDAIERQFRAYDERDVEEFVACYSEAVVVEDAAGDIRMSSREEMRDNYARLFGRYSEQRAETVTRIRVGRYVVDEECVSGRPEGELHAVAIYRLDDQGLIDRVRFLH